MKTRLWGVGLVLIGLVLGFVLASGVLEKSALARTEQGGAASPPPRFQVSAWGFAASGPAGGRAERGCYVLDTVTGELWHVSANGQPQKVADKLR